MKGHQGLTGFGTLRGLPFFGGESPKPQVQQGVALRGLRSLGLRGVEALSGASIEEMRSCSEWGILPSVASSGEASHDGCDWLALGFKPVLKVDEPKRQKGKP